MASPARSRGVASSPVAHAAATSPLLAVADRLSHELARLDFGPPVAFVYNPLEYARDAYAAYVARYAATPKEALLVGMNPGPFGMAQTGVPFGEVASVRDWLGIRTHVGKPSREHSKRPVAGFDCHRSEVSGQRLWGWARRRFGTPDEFFARFFVANYCPLLFLEESGRNLPLDKLARNEQRAIAEHCDEALRETVRALAPRCVLGVGRFAEQRARIALAGIAVETGCVPHPSPASPAANRGWDEQAERAIVGCGIALPASPGRGVAS
ncbi:MAG: single-stranded DNA-binding protein [Rhizobacter sp.]|nr:single-stranded DNA-binding protein [Rhizobacter sp.]